MEEHLGSLSDCFSISRLIHIRKPFFKVYSIWTAISYIRFDLLSYRNMIIFNCVILYLI